MSYDAPPPPPPGYGGATAVPGNNKKAIWSLVLGIVGLVCCGFITGIPAVILGRSAQREIDASGGVQTGRGMATAGFVLGIIAIIWGIIGVILAATGNGFHFSTSTSP